MAQAKTEWEEGCAHAIAKERAKEEAKQRAEREQVAADLAEVRELLATLLPEPILPFADLSEYQRPKYGKTSIYIVLPNAAPIVVCVAANRPEDPIWIEKKDKPLFYMPWGIDPGEDWGEPFYTWGPNQKETTNLNLAIGYAMHLHEQMEEQRAARAARVEEPAAVMVEPEAEARQETEAAAPEPVDMLRAAIALKLYAEGREGPLNEWHFTALMQAFATAAVAQELGRMNAQLESVIGRYGHESDGRESFGIRIIN